MLRGLLDTSVIPPLFPPTRLPLLLLKSFGRERFDSSVIPPEEEEEGEDLEKPEKSLLLDPGRLAAVGRARERRSQSDCGVVLLTLEALEGGFFGGGSGSLHSKKI